MGACWVEAVIPPSEWGREQARRVLGITGHKADCGCIACELDQNDVATALDAAREVGNAERDADVERQRTILTESAHATGFRAGIEAAARVCFTRSIHVPHLHTYDGWEASRRCGAAILALLPPKVPDAP